VSRSSEHLLPEALLAIRALFALIIVHALVSRMREPPTIVTPLRNPFSRTPPATIKMHKWVIFSTFTVQSWTLQLVYFVGTSLLGASNLLGIAPTGFIATFLSAFLWVAFEVSFTASMLVSATTTYVLIPKTLRSGQVPINFFRWSQQAMHNLNVVFMGTELLLNDLPLNPTHIPFPVLWGTHYILFSWVWLRKTGIIYYPFLDPTIPPSISVKVFLLLTCILSLNFGLGLAIATAAASLPLRTRACFVYLGASTLMWTRLRGVPQPVTIQGRPQGFQG